MKIIKHGIIPKEEREEELIGFNVKCRHCGCEFIPYLNEIDKCIRMGGFIEYAWNCPECGTRHETGQGWDYNCEYIKPIYE